MMRKANNNLSCMLLFLFVFFVFFGITQTAESASKYEAAVLKWSRSEEYKNDMGGSFRVKATLYTAEFIDALMQYEAEKNLWTASELEDYKYNFLKGLQLDEYIAVHLELEELGPTAHMSPFDEMVTLWINNKEYKPGDYDKRFNFPLQGKRDGMVFFPRYDEKTGKPLLSKAMTLRLNMKSAVSPVLDSKTVRILWDVKPETGTALAGTATDRIEVDRLIKRVEKLTQEKRDLESQLDAKNKELNEVNARIEELQKQ